MTDSPVTGLLRKARLRETLPRKIVLDALAAIGGPTSAYALRDHLRAAGQPLNVVTIYRVLDAFESAGAIHRHPCDGTVALCSMPQVAGHHGFLHCTGCGRTEEFVSRELCRVEDEIAARAKFSARSHSSEILGLCATCSPSSSRS